GTDQHFRLDEFADVMRSRLVSAFSDALGTAQIPALDLASRYTEVGEALLPVINPIVRSKYGIEITSFILENVSVPPEVEQAIDKRSGMGAVGNLNDYVKYQLAQGLSQGGAANAPAEMAMGFALAQQILQQQGGLAGGATPIPPPLPGAAAPAAAPAVDLLSPADVARILG